MQARALATLGALVALLAHPASAQVLSTQTATRPAAPVVSYAVERSSGAHDLWSIRGRGTPRLALADVSFLPIRLVGYPRKDRLRLDRPASEAEGSVARIRLVGDGALYRVSTAGTTGLLQVRSDAAPRLLFALRDGPSGPALEEAVHVSPDGRLACVASAPDAGGHVWIVDLQAASAFDATAGLPPLDLEPDSLRVSAAGLWFVVDGALYRDDHTKAGAPSPVSLGPDPVDSELALSRASDKVLVRTLQPDGDASLYVVPSAGAIATVGDEEREYSGPSYDHPLGPFLVLSPLGDFVGARELESNHHEFYVMPVSGGAPERHLTRNPEFPGYVDNIGICAFGQSNVLCFFGGDTKKSGVVLDEEIGAADMYAVHLDPSGSVAVLKNITVTSGDQTPPFKKVARMRFREAFVGPLGERIHVIGDAPGGGSGLEFFDVEGGVGPQVTTHGGMTSYVADPLLAGSSAGLLDLSQVLDRYPQAWISCSGDALSTPLVRLLATDKSDPLDGGAKVWHDGIVGLGQEFTLRAANAGEARLKNDTYLHVLDPSGTPLQTTRLETSCDEPLFLGDRFGASVLVDYVGEDELPGGSYDYCAWGEKPSALYFTYTGADCAATSHAQASGKVTCSGDPAYAPQVWILASDKSDPADSGAKVWFSGVVALGDSFVVDAAGAGEEHLSKNGFIHVLTTGGSVLQTVQLHTECDQPLFAGDTFGALRLDQCVLEKLPIRGDQCVSGKPLELVLRYEGLPCGLLPMAPELSLLRSGSTDAEALTVRGPALVPGMAFDRLGAGRSPSTAAFVATLAGGRQRLYAADLALGVVDAALEADALSAELALLPDGRVVFTAAEGGGWSLYQLTSGGGLLRLPLAGPGFPLVP